MELIQIFAILTVALNFASSQQLGRTVTKSENGCTEAVKEYIGAQNGDEVTINYTGWLRDTSSSGSSWNKGKQFDSSKGGEPITFILGEGRVIKGWDDGLIGTCQGESLRLEIPSVLAYGDQGRNDIFH
jgi:FKBP-type peptidyl-prolyl cis-trans isomerase